jgi:hypothetical protein
VGKISPNRRESVENTALLYKSKTTADSKTPDNPQMAFTKDKLVAKSNPYMLHAMQNTRVDSKFSRVNVNYIETP